MKKNIFIALVITLFILPLFLKASAYRDGFLPIGLTEEEMGRLDEIGYGYRQTDPPSQPSRHIAEFEPMSGVLIRYPLGIPVSLVALFSEEIEVVTIVSSQNVQNQAINAYQNAGVNMDNCSFLIAGTNSYWTRDYGPWFIFDGENEIGVVDFNYNRPRPLDNAIPNFYANHYDLNYYHIGLTHTGGNYMCDGMGVGASTQIAYTENSSLTPAQVDGLMEEFLGISNYHVVQDPTGTYIDHIDTWAKFLAPDKILIRSVPESHSQYNQIEQTVTYFAQQTSSYGTPYQIYRVYTPNNQPYTNSLILNDRVFVPITGSVWDDAAIQSYEEAMPGYTIHGIFFNGWQSTDALHCRTREIADKEMLYISHMPYLGEQEFQGVYPINAHIYAYSGEDLIDDSLQVYYAVNGSQFENILLTESGESTFEALLMGFAPGDTISYYITASDNSGRTSKKPFIGEADPYVFVIGSEGVVPEISHEPVQSAYLHEFPLTLQAEVSSLLDIYSVQLHFRVNGSSITAIEFSADPENDDFWQLEFDPSVENLDVVSYKIVAFQHGDPPVIATFPNSGWIYMDISIMQLDDVLFYPEPGAYYGDTPVFLKIDFDDVIIFYTLDGSLPDFNSEIYNEPIVLTESAVVKAFASGDDFLESEISEAEYIIKSNNTEDEVGISTQLYQAYPNPFNPDVTISFYLSRKQEISLTVFTLTGRKITELAKGEFEPGFHSYFWNSEEYFLPSGIYFYRLETEDYSQTKKMLLLK